MISREIFYNSFVIVFLINFIKFAACINKKINFTYINSNFYAILFKSKGKIQIYAMNCFLVKIINFQGVDIAFFKGSSILSYLIISFMELKSKLIRYFGLSSTGAMSKFILAKLNSLFFKVITLFFFIIILCNIVEYGFFYRQIEIGLWGWLMRGILLLMSILVIFSKANWTEVKLKSIFLKKLA